MASNQRLFGRAVSRERVDSRPAAPYAEANAQRWLSNDRENDLRRSAGAFFYSLVEAVEKPLN